MVGDPIQDMENAKQALRDGKVLFYYGAPLDVASEDLNKYNPGALNFVVKFDPKVGAEDRFAGSVEDGLVEMLKQNGNDHPSYSAQFNRITGLARVSCEEGRTYENAQKIVQEYHLEALTREQALSAIKQ